MGHTRMSLFTVSHYFSRNGEQIDGFERTRVRRPSASQAPSVHWAEEMDGAGDVELREQIKRAKEMGYSDEALYEALRKNSQTGEILYHAFTDMNCMLDLLNKSQDVDAEPTKKEKDSGCSSDSSPSLERSSLSGRGYSTLSLEQRPPHMKISRSPRSYDSPRSATVCRSSSFQVDSRKASCAPRETNDITRLLVTLDKENERNRKNQMEQIELLVQKVDDMKKEQNELRNKLDEKILAELQLEKQLKDQKELEEYRKAELNERSERLQGELAAASEERDQMRREMQDHIHRETELQAVIEEKERIIEDMIENSGSISRRSSVFRPHCIICLEKWPNIVFSKCMHLAVCEECFVVAASNASAPLKTCPTCREPITGSLKVYM